MNRVPTAYLQTNSIITQTLNKTNIKSRLWESKLCAQSITRSSKFSRLQICPWQLDSNSITTSNRLLTLARWRVLIDQMGTWTTFIISSEVILLQQQCPGHPQHISFTAIGRIHRGQVSRYRQVWIAIRLLIQTALSSRQQWTDPSWTLTMRPWRCRLKTSELVTILVWMDNAEAIPTASSSASSSVSLRQQQEIQHLGIKVRGRQAFRQVVFQGRSVPWLSNQSINLAISSIHPINSTNRLFKIISLKYISKKIFRLLNSRLRARTYKNKVYRTREPWVDHCLREQTKLRRVHLPSTRSRVDLPLASSIASLW